MRTDIDGLDEAIKNELENWSNGELRRAVNESMEETAGSRRKFETGRPLPGKNGKIYQGLDARPKEQQDKRYYRIEWVQCLQQKTLSVDPFTGKRAPVTQGRQESRKCKGV